MCLQASLLHHTSRCPLAAFTRSQMTGSTKGLAPDLHHVLRHACAPHGPPPASIYAQAAQVQAPRPRRLPGWRGGPITGARDRPAAGQIGGLQAQVPSCCCYWGSRWAVLPPGVWPRWDGYRAREQAQGGWSKQGGRGKWHRWLHVVCACLSAAAELKGALHECIDSKLLSHRRRKGKDSCAICLISRRRLDVQPPPAWCCSHTVQPSL